jgi:hypothetical protein
VYIEFPRISASFGIPRPPFGTSGVGHNEESVTEVRGTEGGSGYAIPFRVIPARGQVAEYAVKSPSKECCHVLHEDVAGS